MPGRVTGMSEEAAGHGFRARRPGSNEPVESSGREVKGQVGSVDLTMVAKASL